MARRQTTPKTLAPRSTCLRRRAYEGRAALNAKRADANVRDYVTTFSRYYGRVADAAGRGDDAVIVKNSLLTFALVNFRRLALSRVNIGSGAGSTQTTQHITKA